MVSEFPCAGMTSFRITRANHCDDVLTAKGAYLRVHKDGRLLVFSGSGLGMGPREGYPPGDWTGIFPFTTQQGSDQ